MTFVVGRGRGIKRVSDGRGMGSGMGEGNGGMEEGNGVKETVTFGAKCVRR
jgi:hypothetical protein